MYLKTDTLTFHLFIIQLLTFHHSFFYNHCYNTSICILIIIKVCVFRKVVGIFIFNPANFTFFNTVLVFTFNFENSFIEIINNI